MQTEKAWETQMEKPRAWETQMERARAREKQTEKARAKAIDSGSGWQRPTGSESVTAKESAAARRSP